MNDFVAPMQKKRGRQPDKALAAMRSALLTLVEQSQFDRITTRDIIQEARVSPATFYRHYRSKTALLHAVADNEIEILVNLSSAATASPRKVSLAQIRHLDAHRSLWSVLLNGGAASYVREGFIRRLTREYSNERWKLETWLPNELAIRFSVAAMVEIVTWWLDQSEPQPIETIAEMLERLTVQPTLAAMVK